MLEVVQQQQAHAITQERRQGLGQVLPGHFAHAHHAGDRRHHQGGIDQRRQVDKPDPVGEVLPHALRGGDGQAGLADPTRSGQGQQADLLAGEEGAEARQLLLPVDQPRRLRRERVRVAVSRRRDGDQGRGAAEWGGQSP